VGTDVLRLVLRKTVPNKLSLSPPQCARIGGGWSISFTVMAAIEGEMSAEIKIPVLVARASCSYMEEYCSYSLST
jgi:hypothetical protein